MSVQYTAIFYGCKDGNFLMKKMWYFFLLNFAKNIYRGYKLEHPQWGGSNEYPPCMFKKNKKKMYTHVNPNFSIWKWSVMGSTLHGHVSMMHVFILFDLILNVPVNNFSVMLGRRPYSWVLPVLLGSKCLLLKETTHRPGWGSNPGLPIRSPTL